MRVLLDTHALLWALAEPRHLSQRATAVLRNTTIDLLVSSVTAWEISTKYRLGKLPGAGAIVDGYAAHLAELRANELPIRSQHALMAGWFRIDHRDPFDRMLAAQAILEGVPLLTNDPAFKVFSDLETIW